MGVRGALTAIVLACMLASALPLPAAEPAPEDAAGARIPVEVTDVRFPEAAARALPEHGAWLPVYVELRTPSLEAEVAILEGALARERGLAFLARDRIEVAPGAPRRAWLYLQARPAQIFTETATFEVKSSLRGVIRTGDRWSVGNVVQSDAWLRVLVVGEDATAGLPWPRGTSPLGAAGASAISESVELFPSRALPDSLLGYSLFDMVVLRELGSEGLEPAQVEALRAWIRLGGCLVVAPVVRSAEVYRSEVIRAIAGDRLGEPSVSERTPAQLFSVLRRGGLDPRSQVVGLVPEAERPSLYLIDPLPPGVDLEILASEVAVEGRATSEVEGSFRLYGAIGVGAGRLGVLAPVGLWPQPENATFLRLLWGRVTLSVLEERRRDRSALGRLANPVAPEITRLLEDRSRDVGLPFIAALILGYLILAGPVTYLALRRMRRLLAVIWVQPLLVVVYLGVIFAVGYITKGVLTRTRIWTVTSQREGDPLAFRESYLTVFSAEETTYKVSSPDGFLLSPLFKNEAAVQPIRVVRGSGAEGPAGSRSLAIEGFRLKHWEEGTFVNLGVEDLGGPGVEVVWPVAAEPPEGEPPPIVVTNRLPHAVVDGVVADRLGSQLAVPRIEPGQAVRIPRRPPGNQTKANPNDMLGTVSKVERGGFFLRGPVLFAGRVERERTCFSLNRRSTLREKADLYVLYAGQ